MELEYDERKARTNFRKHGILFEETWPCFFDPNALILEDPDANDERRWILWGMDANGRLLAVVHTTRGLRIRIISARKATPGERATYAKRIRHF